ncbi:helix-turn-helix domain-containing protein [Chryseobacterium ureilyticum]|uniref:helix-turn-helix domain-containing protein n=1 Tax=Chryseobacterium ureilyticum TaxID=373668 RepID=UPI0009710507|nr:helix-turn-helix domain-containing protein [Chryseobacterium ureilyticum]
MEFILIEKNAYEALNKEIVELNKLLSELVAPYQSIYSKNRWLDNQEVCQLLNISKRSLQNYKQKGLLPCTCISRKNYFKYNDVIALLQSKS